MVPFDNRQHMIAAVYWLSEASAVLLADELQARGVGAITRRERVRAFEQLHLPLSASLSRATLIKSGRAGRRFRGHCRYIHARARHVEGGSHTIRIDVGRLQPDVVEQAPLNGLISMFESLARRLAPDARPPAAGRPPRPPLVRFQKN